MTELIRAWLMGLTAAALINAVAMSLAPKGKQRAVVGLTCGLVTVIALVAPILDFDYEAYAFHMGEAEPVLERRLEEMEQAQERLTQAIIRERSEAYILDKANFLDIAGLAVAVETAISAYGVVYPYRVWLRGEITEEQRRALEHFLVGTFGIPAERQHWSVTDE